MSADETPQFQTGRPGPLGERRDAGGELDAAVNPGAWKDRLDGEQPCVAAMRRLVEAADRMRDRWAEATPEVRNRDLWRPLHDAADAAREVLERSCRGES